MMPNVGRENLLEKFVIMGSVEEEVDVLGTKIKLRVLDSGEQREVFEVTASLDVVSRLRGIQHETLARSIISINGQAIAYVPKDKGETIDEYKLIQQNLETLRKATHPVINEIFTEYEKLVSKQEKQIDGIKKKLKKPGRETDGESQKQSESKESSE